MDFHFVPPRRTMTADKVEGTREDKVTALAKLLHQRGLTSTMANARRLAEGMVEVEKKVIKPSEPATRTVHLSELPADFLHFVEQAAAIPHEEIKPAVIVTESKAPAQVTSEKPTAKQVFFADAPDLSKARGYSGPKFQAPEFHSQKVLARAEAAAKEAEILARKTQQEAAQTVAEVVTQVVEETRVEEELGTSEEFIVQPQEALETTIESVTQEPEEQETAAAETASEIVETVTPQVPEEKREETAEPETKEVETKVDLAKQHGVDLFEMFKKK